PGVTWNISTCVRSWVAPTPSPITKRPTCEPSLTRRNWPWITRSPGCGGRALAARSAVYPSPLKSSTIWCASAFATACASVSCSVTYSPTAWRAVRRGEVPTRTSAAPVSKSNTTIRPGRGTATVRSAWTFCTRARAQPAASAAAVASSSPASKCRVLNRPMWPPFGCIDVARGAYHAARSVQPHTRLLLVPYSSGRYVSACVLQSAECRSASDDRERDAEEGKEERPDEPQVLVVVDLCDGESADQHHGGW